ncbi:hypothetical protein EI42_01699 [Thermosporothrix hazakensis]|uniref:Uncharacterized protein n=1 Tax=Thermosporothrix hazakensis TaxID=644383 RepID=A0A326UPU7_THEHA|nr:hypothetical protein EI42_01699 [Thermosporothrix hazakensis]
MFTTLEHFLQLNPQTILCSHGRTISPDSIKANVAYLHKVEPLCRTLLSQRLPGFDRYCCPCAIAHTSLRRHAAGNAISPRAVFPALIQSLLLELSLFEQKIP